jgi:hypothetical protein
MIFFDHACFIAASQIEFTNRENDSPSSESITKLLQTGQDQNLTHAFIKRLERLADQSAWALNRSPAKIERL